MHSRTSYEQRNYILKAQRKFIMKPFCWLAILAVLFICCIANFSILASLDSHESQQKKASPVDSKLYFQSANQIKADFNDAKRNKEPEDNNQIYSEIDTSANVINSDLNSEHINSGPYTPDWESIDSRPLPTWYDEAKVGIFIHWGIWAVPGVGSEPAFFWNFWKNGKPEIVNFMKENYYPGFTYGDFASEFKANLFDASEWINIFKASGAKYIVYVSKHHDGYPMWPSKYSFGWNSGYVGPRRDFVGELETAVRNGSDLHFGLYHSLFEFYNPLYLRDAENNYTTNDFVQRKTMPELYELVNRYKPEVIWSDGDWDVGPEYWNSTNFLAWLYNQSPVKDTVVTNDRWGKGTSCHHGGYYTCTDKYNPKVLQKHKFENCLTLDRSSWGYRRQMKAGDVLSMKELTTTLAETISCGGNFLLNVGPHADGTIPPIFEERLRDLGDWLRVNGEGVYGSKPWTHQSDNVDPHVWYTKKTSSGGSTSVYAFVLDWPENNIVFLGAPMASSDTVITLLGHGVPLKWDLVDNQLVIHLPHLNEKTAPCQYAWVLRMDNLFNA